MPDKQANIVAVVQHNQTYNQHSGLTIRFGEIYRYTPTTDFGDNQWRFQYLSECRYADDSIISGIHLTCSLSSGQPESHHWRLNLPELSLSYQYDAIERLDTHVKQTALIRKAVKRLDAIDAEFGPAQTFGEYVQRVLKGLGVNYYVMAGEVSDYTQTWEFYPYTPPVKDIRQAIDSLISQQIAVWTS